MAAEKVLDKARAIAAHQLECSEDDLEYVGRRVPGEGHAHQGDGDPGAIAFEAFTAHDLPDGMEPNLTADRSPTTRRTSRSRSAPTSPSSRSTRRPATSSCVGYAAVDDCGDQINPMIVEGQVHGGIVQGVAQALWEEAVYDEDGNLRNPTLIDYCVPSAAELPSFKLGHTVTPSPDQPARREGHRRGRHDRLGAGA